MKRCAPPTEAPTFAPTEHPSLQATPRTEGTNRPRTSARIMIAIGSVLPSVWEGSPEGKEGGSVRLWVFDVIRKESYIEGDCIAWFFIVTHADLLGISIDAGVQGRCA